MWLTTLREWSCQESTARSLIALAEREGCDVLMTGPRARAAVTQTPEPAPRWGAGAGSGNHEQPDPGQGLW